MIRKASIIGTLALGMAITAFHGVPSMEQLASSARNFKQNFHNLKRTDSLNPVERFVFSLVLANTKTENAAPAPKPIQISDAAAPRT